MNKTSLNARRLQGIFYILIASVIWGTIPMIIRYVDGASTIKVFARVFFALIALTIYLAWTKKLPRLFIYSKQDERQLVAQGMILGINWILFLGAFEFANVAVVELLGYMGPVFVALMLPLVLRERFDKRIIIPLALSMVGMFVILAPHGLALETNTRALVGAGMAILSALTYAVITLNGKRFLNKNVPTTTLLFYENAAGSLLLIPFIIWAYGTGQGPTGGLVSYFWLMILGVVHTGFASVLFIMGLKRMRADQAAVFTYMEPVSAIIFASLFLGEHLTWSTVIGGALVVIGGTIVSQLDAKEGIDIVPLEAGAIGEIDTAPEESDLDTHE